ncbi:MAG: hypothetical protein EAZ90_05125 [Oscillatoriales cyanobacterium]|nr:MAG: hypothetical protein EAZ94_16405 [Oscillatoriales cyanobacterium]TAE22799.1 MAG: hypothetical protein EAZ93_17035 [Oscillatoriales cyanobacterium]TAE44566.1 MAG: hypothetical protein EAZ90_05125 [Oscillatoriales cyanobacterium]TAE52351.1 MAG: hypothetical protein EAZ88_15420 [Oscillatoriales cyanobacterium]TAE63388.1 MAG: hypothetical protein EAZ86_28950 [Oscillatoriales cyanobacterium]
MVGENLSIKYPSQQCLTEIRKHQSENFYLTSKRRIQWAKQSKSLAAEKHAYLLFSVLKLEIS